jgi:hypothetical protein
LIGHATLRPPNGLELVDCSVWASGGQCSASLPPKPVLTREGNHIEVGGVKQYVATAARDDRSNSDRWSATVSALVGERYLEALDGEVAP